MSKVFKVLEAIGNALCLPLVFLFVFAIEMYFKLEKIKKKYFDWRKK